MEVSVGASLGHIQTFVHPQVIITDDASREDTFFIKAIRAKAVAIDKSVIELPSDAAENLMWITRLDSSSLAGKQTTWQRLLEITNSTLSVAYHICRHSNSCSASVIGFSTAVAKIH